MYKYIRIMERMDSLSEMNKLHRTIRSFAIGLAAFSLMLPAVSAGAASNAQSTQASKSSASKDMHDVAILNSTDLSVADHSKVKFTQEQAVAKVKELFPVLKDAQVQQVTLGITNQFPKPKNQMVWSIEWNINSGDTYYGFESRVDAITGDLISTHIQTQQHEQDSYYPPKVTKEEAIELAKNFISKAIKSAPVTDVEFDSETSSFYSPRALFGPVEYGFVFNRKINGLMAPNETLYVNVDGSGQITSFHTQSDRYEYPSSKPKLNQDAANQLFSEQFDIELSYVPVYKNGEQESFVLAWAPTERSTSYIDANTGKRIHFLEGEETVSKLSHVQFKAGKQVFKPANKGRELTSAEAVKRVEEVAVIPKGRKLSNQNLNNDFRNSERKVWNLYWTEAEEQMQPRQTYIPPAETMAEVDALTGQIISYRLDAFIEETDGKKPSLPVPKGIAKLNEESAKQRAIELINILYPEASKNLKLVEQGGSHKSKDGNTYHFEFVYFMNNIKIANASPSMTIDQYGRLIIYNATPVNNIEEISKLPAAKITKEEAKKAYLDRYEVKLQYQNFGEFQVDYNYIEPHVRLVYALNVKDSNSMENELLDAASGKWVNTFEQPSFQEGETEPKDIQGHRAEQELKTLLKYNVLSVNEEGNINPDQSITIGDWLEMMANGVTPQYSVYHYMTDDQTETIAGVSKDSPDYLLVNYAASRGWISKDESLDLKHTLTREKLAFSISSMIKYNKLAAFLKEDPSLKSFSDLSQTPYSGEIALMLKLGLMEGQNGKFNPAAEVTKADAAVIMMKLVEIQSKLDQIIVEH